MNIEKIRSLFLISVMGGIVLLTGCTFTPAALVLKPPIDTSGSDIGQGVPIAFKFVDERDDVTIGHRGVATVGAKISSEDLPAIVESDLRNDITNKHFNIVSDGKHAETWGL